MGEDVDSYIAWDGQRYFGDPPDGWFLAADNRWWPSKELIDDTAHTTEGAASGHTASSSHTAGAESAAVSTAQAQPAQGSAPPPPVRTSTSPDHTQHQTGGQPPPPIGQTRRRTRTSTHRGQTPQVRTRRRKKRRVPPMLMIFIGFVVLRNAGNVLNTIGDSFDQGAPAEATEEVPFEPDPNQVEFAEEVEEPVDAPTTASNPPLPTFDNGDFELQVTGCGPGILTAMMTNTGNTATAFDVTVVVATDGPTPLRSTLFRTVDVLEPGVAEPLVMPLPDTMAGESCTVRVLTTTAVG